MGRPLLWLSAGRELSKKRVFSILFMPSRLRNQRAYAGLVLIKHYCFGASVASEQQHKQDLRRIYKREYEFSKSLFSRMLCVFLPECIAPSTRVHCATNSTGLCHCCDGVLLLRGLLLRQVSGYGLL